MDDLIIVVKPIQKSLSGHKRLVVKLKLHSQRDAQPTLTNRLAGVDGLKRSPSPALTALYANTARTARAAICIVHVSVTCTR